MNETVTIILPLPSKYLSPNYKPYSRGGAIAKSRATRSYRSLARKAAVETGVESGPWNKVKAYPVFFHKMNRKRDDINHAQMLKPAFDGVVDAGIAVDDSSEYWKTQEVQFFTDKASPRVELTIERVL